MIHTFALLLGFQLAGELIARGFGLPVPGPVIGMALFLALLLVRGEISHELRTGTAGLLQHLSLFFVPAGVGIIVHLHRVSQEWLAISLALLVSTVAGLAVTALVLEAFIRARRRAGETR